MLVLDVGCETLLYYQEIVKYYMMCKCVRVNSCSTWSV